MRDVGGEALVEEIGERVDAIGGDGQPGRHRVAAAGDEQPAVLRGKHRRAEIDAGDRAARALAEPVLAERDDDRGPAQPLLQAAGDDADHAGMPAGRGDDRDGAIALRGAQRLRRLADRGLDRAALLVEPVELGGDRRGLVRILGGQQADAEIGLADPAAGVDPRAEREAEIAAFRRAGEPGGVGERGEADVAAAGHHLQPLRDEGAVEAAKLGDIGDGAERDEIEQFDQLRLGPAGEEAAARAGSGARPRRAGRRRRPRRDGRAPRASVASSSRFGLTKAKASGKPGGAFVMIDDDHVDAGRLRHVERLERLRAAIDGDDQPRAALGDPHQRLAGGAVALHQPVGDIGLRIEAEIAQQADQQGGRGRAVDVIIAEDGDRLAGLDRVGEPCGGRVHVAEAATDRA